MTEKDLKLVKDVARFMAKAFWRGKLSTAHGLTLQDKAKLIEQNGEKDAPRWEAGAKALLLMNENIPTD